MAITYPLPVQYVRQFSAAMDVDLVFGTTDLMQAYLSSPRRYAGMVVSNLDDANYGVYQLNKTKDAWIKLATDNNDFIFVIPIAYETLRTQIFNGTANPRFYRLTSGRNVGLLILVLSPDACTNLAFRRYHVNSYSKIKIGDNTGKAGYFNIKVGPNQVQLNTNPIQYNGSLSTPALIDSIISHLTNTNYTYSNFQGDSLLITGKDPFNDNGKVVLIDYISGDLLEYLPINVMTGGNKVDKFVTYDFLSDRVSELFIGVVPPEDVTDYSDAGQLVGAIDGVNSVFTTRFEFVPSTTKVSVEGLRMTLGDNSDYIESGPNEITFSYPPENEVNIVVDYKKLL
jgi:hypothetical protein